MSYTVDDVKDWLERQDALVPFSVGASLPEKIVVEVERFGYERIRVVRVGPHPVWSVTARVGGSIYDCDHILKVLIKRLAKNLGFSVKMRDIVARVRGGRIQAVFCLDTPLKDRHAGQ